MAAGRTFEERLRLIFETQGTKKALNQLNQLDRALEKQRKADLGMVGGAKKDLLARQKASNRLTQEQVKFENLLSKSKDASVAKIDKQRRAELLRHQASSKEKLKSQAQFESLLSKSKEKTALSTDKQRRAELLRQQASAKEQIKEQAKFESALSKSKRAATKETLALAEAEKRRNNNMALNELKKQKDALSASANEAKRFKGEYLGIMFAGMSLQRVFGGMTKKLLSNYKDMVGEGVTPLSEGLTRLEASFKFLQFSIVEAAGPLILAFTNALSGMAESLAKMDPGVLKSIFASVVTLAGVGGIMNVFGQGAIFFSSIASAKASRATVDALVAAGNLDEAAFKSGSSFFSDWQAMAGGVITLFAAIKTVKDLTSKEEASLGTIIFNSLTAGLGTGLMVGSAAGALAGGVAGLIAAGTIALIMTVSNKSKADAEKDMKEFKKRLISQGLTPEQVINDPRATQAAITQATSFEYERRQETLNPFDDMDHEEIRTDMVKEYNDIIDDVRAGIISKQEGMEDIQDLLMLPSSEQVSRYREQLGIVTTETNNLNTGLDTVSTTMSSTLPEHTGNWIRDEENGLKAAKTESESIVSTLSSPITVPISFDVDESSVDRAKRRIRQASNVNTAGPF